MAYPKVPRMSQ